MLIKNLAQVKKVYGGNQRSMDFETWEPFLEEATEFFLIPAVGEELVDHLDSLVGNSNEEDVAISGSDKEQRLVKLLRMSLMAYADSTGMMRQIVSTGDSGKAMISPANMQAVSKWATVASITGAIHRGDLALETALVFLEKNVADFTVWKESEFFLENSKLLVSNAAKLTEGFPAANYSRRMWLAMRAELAKAQEGLAVQFGSEFLEDILAKNKAAIEGVDIGADWKKLISMCVTVICRKAVADRIPFLNIDESWHLWSSTDGIENKDVLSTDRRSEIKAKVEQQYHDALSSTMDFLQGNASVSLFETFFGSELFKGIGGGVVKRFFENDAGKSYVVI